MSQAKGFVINFDHKPISISDCRGCTACLLVCPRFQEAGKTKIAWIEDSQEDALVGRFAGVYGGRATNNAIKLAGQDGGAVTSIIAHALESKTIDGAILTGQTASEPWMPVPIVARSLNEVVACAGSKYAVSSVFLALDKAVHELDLRSLAIVGLPCQVQATRRIQASALERLASSIKLVVGLWCSECFDHEWLKRRLHQEGVSLADVRKFNIKGKFTATLKDGRSIDVPLEEVKNNRYKGCYFCSDFAAEYADLSAGAAGVKAGWTILLPRTKIGKEVMLAAATSGSLELREISIDKGLKLARSISEKKKIQSRTLPKVISSGTPFDHLSAHIVETGACCACAACYSVCTKQLPWIIQEKCDGCGDCIKRCPFDALELLRRATTKSECAWVTHPEYCTGCGGCAPACRPNAIRMISDIRKAVETYSDLKMRP